MRPSMLKIEGLNSFLQTEEIDFNKLTQRGLFGIFGPTGSGKSTILDAITLALYGEVARKTKSYINSDLDRAYIYFEFFAGHGEQQKKYIIERSIKKTETGIQTAKIKLEIYDANDNCQRIIENRTPVENELRENIIRLNFEDFIRTVVLPQGKFSEFLTLTGAERNHMLERILGLEEYGKGLTAKINNKKDITNNELNRLNGELSRYSDSSEEKIKELEAAKKEISEEEIQLKAKIDILEKDYKKYTEIYSLQKELKTYIKQQKEISQKKDEIDRNEKNLQKGKDALHISPYVETFESALNKYKSNKDKLDALKIQIKTLSQEILKVDNDYKKAYKLKDQEYPKLIEKNSQIDRAIDLENEKNKTKKLLQQESKDLCELKSNIEKLEEQYKQIKLIRQEIEKNIEQTEKKVSRKTITTQYRNRLIEGLDIEKNYAETKKDLEKSEKDYIEAKARIEKGKIEINKLKTKSKELQESIADNKTTYIYIKNTLFSMENKLKQIDRNIEKIKEKSLANELVKTLEKDCPCPLCGSIEHPNIVESVENWELIVKEEEKVKLESQIETLKINLNVIDSIAYSIELKLRDSDINKISTEQLDKNIWEKKCTELKENLEKILTEKLDVNDKQIKYTARLGTIEESLIDLGKQGDQLKTKNKQLEKSYKDIKKELKIENIKSRYEEVKKTEQELEQLNKKLIEDRAKFKEVDQTRSNIDKKLNDNKSKVEVLNSTIKNKVESIEKNNCEIIKITGHIKPKTLKENIEKQISEITNNEKDLKEKLEHLKQEDSNLKEQQLIIAKSNETLEVTIEGSKEKINSLLEEYNFQDIEQVKTSSISRDKIDLLENQIDQYKKKKDNILANIERVKKLLDNEFITDENLKKLKDSREKAIKRQRELLEDKGKTIEQLDGMNKNLETVKKLQRDIDKLEQRKDSLDEIYRITKGKKFVEFVSRNHLEYIAKAATKQLKSITRGRYGLVLSEDNAFEVIDNYNGGVRRDCSSLSGGETFLTSLALALALSTKIQLKGDTSMEFFFLDEGFGTLDVETLDTAMTALENLHTENLSVGIISHVEEIKNRVPIKLMVTAPVPGIHGSKVEIVKT